LSETSADKLTVKARSNESTMARPHPALIDIAAGRAARTVDNEVAFVESALEHRMAGLASWAAANGTLTVGPEARQTLAALKLAAAAHNVKVEAATVKTIGTLRSAGWDAAIFKGVATEMRWYPERGTRPTADVDLMLNPRSRANIDEIVRLLAPGHALSGRAQLLVDGGLIQSIDIPVGDIWVDLHTDPIKVGIRLPGIERLWARRDKILIDSMEVAALDAEASLFQAAIHLQKDRFSRLYGFTDVAQIAAGSDLDWDWIQNYAADTGLAIHLNESLRVVADTLGIDLPVLPGKDSRVWRAIWPERSRLRGGVGMTRRVRAHQWIPLTMPGRRRDALRWWGRVVFPPAEIVDYMHPDTSGPYPWRLIQYRSRLAYQRHRRNREQRRRSDI